MPDLRNICSVRRIYNLFIIFLWCCSFFQINIIPQKWVEINDLLISMDSWILNHVQSLTIFIVLSGVLIGTIIYPAVLEFIKYILRPKIEITPIFIDGFGAISSAGDQEVEYLNILIGVKSFENEPTALIDWGIELIVANKKYVGVPRYQLQDIEIRGAKNQKNKFPPAMNIVEVTKKPISAGEQVFGVIQVEMIGLRAQPLDEETMLIIKSRDKKGNSIKSKTILKEIQAKGPQYIPGLEKYFVVNNH
jgi:hypothetical protein